MRHAWVAATVVIVVGCGHGTAAKKPDQKAAESAPATTDPQASVTADERPIESQNTGERQQDERADAAQTERQDKPVDSTPQVRGDTKERAMAQIVEFKNQMCACKDATCTQRVSDDMRKWADEMNRSGEKPPQMTDDDARQAKTIGEELKQCMQKAFNK